MEATFTLDPRYSLYVSGGTHPPHTGDVRLRLDKSEVFSHPSRDEDKGGTIFTVALTPSHARAIASAILSAATEARS